jgi:hypothetical protein
MPDDGHAGAQAREDEGERMNTSPPAAGSTEARAPDGRDLRQLLHDVNNHLGVVVAHLDLIDGRDDLPPEVRASVGEAVEACVAMIAELQQVQAIARTLNR